METFSWKWTKIRIKKINKPIQGKMEKGGGFKNNRVCAGKMGNNIVKNDASQAKGEKPVRGSGKTLWRLDCTERASASTKIHVWSRGKVHA